MKNEVTKPIRVVHVLNSLNCGGAETLAVNLLRHIDRSKYAFDFVVHTDTEGFYDKEVESMGARIYRIPQYKIYNHAEYIKAWKELLRLHPEWKIIHGHVYSIASVYLKVAKNFGLKTICHVHGVSFGTGIKGTIKNFYKRRVRAVADYKLACSKEAAVWMYGTNCLNDNNTMVLNNGIDINKYTVNVDIRKTMRNRYGIPESTEVLGHIGRFNACKNHEFLVNVFAAYHSQHADSMLVLVGDGELRQKIKEKVVAMGLQGKVLFVGLQNNVADYLQMMDVFLLPSLYEGLGIVLIEAQANALRCVVTDSLQVSKDGDISGESIFVPLDVNTWIAAIKIQIGKGRLKNLQYLQNSPYDIKNSIRKLVNLYTAEL